MSRFELQSHQLPTEIAIFPLPGAILLPGQILPLNIFEDRYLNMIEDALSAQRLIGMIQPKAPTEIEEKTQIVHQDSGLYDIGGLGRIIHFEETSDGRFVIQLKGVSRFHLKAEEVVTRGYRRAFVDYQGVDKDLTETSYADEALVDRTKLFKHLEYFSKIRHMKLDVRLFEKIQMGSLIDILSMICPFAPAEKQALLESPTAISRGHLLLSLLEMAEIQSDSHNKNKHN